MHYDYNNAGQVAAITLPGNLRTAFQYDQAGQVSKTILPDGSGIMTARDTEGRTERSARYLDAESDVSANLPDIRLSYDRPTDQPGRLTQMSDALGVIGKYRYNDVGRVAAITNALGIASKFAYGAEGRISGRTDAADSADAASVGMAYDNAGHATSITAANGVVTMRRYDDFGQKVMEADPDHGVTLFRYDAAGRMVARLDETLVATRIRRCWATAQPDPARWAPFAIPLRVCRVRGQLAPPSKPGQLGAILFYDRMVLGEKSH